MEQVDIKNKEQIQRMREVGRLASEVLDFITPYVEVGITTEELDRLCHNFIVHNQKSIPAPLNYRPSGALSAYPKSICTSVNHVICHGIPNSYQLKKGDIINIDLTLIKNGYHGDCSRMFYMSGVSLPAKRICEAAHISMWLGIQAVRPGAPLSNIGRAIQQFCNKTHYSIVKDFCGHGIGKKFHEPPQILHYFHPISQNLIMQPGMTFTIEPMINAGKYACKILPDGWTAITRDRSLSAQWEHTIVVTSSGYEVLTLSDQAPSCPTKEEIQYFSD